MYFNVRFRPKVEVIVKFVLCMHQELSWCQYFVGLSFNVLSLSLSLSIYIYIYIFVKDVGHFGSSLRSVFSLGVSQHMHKRTNLYFELNRSSKLQGINEIKNTLVTRSCVLSDA